MDYDDAQLLKSSSPRNRRSRRARQQKLDTEESGVKTRECFEWYQLHTTKDKFGLSYEDWSPPGLRLKENRFDEALTLYKRVVELDPLERDASPLYHVGQILLYQGQYAESAAYLTAAAAGYYSPLTTPPEEIWHDYGLALWFSGDVLKSLENFENAVMVNPVFPKGQRGCTPIASHTPCRLSEIQPPTKIKKIKTATTIF
eukprot:1083516-Amphidinium_carterae.1